MKYNSSKVLLFIEAKKAGSILMDDPYQVRFVDDYESLISRPVQAWKLARRAKMSYHSVNLLIGCKMSLYTTILQEIKSPLQQNLFQYSQLEDLLGSLIRLTELAWSQIWYTIW
jgi:hypothetical protein